MSIAAADFLSIFEDCHGFVCMMPSMGGVFLLYAIWGYWCFSRTDACSQFTVLIKIHIEVIIVRGMNVSLDESRDAATEIPLETPSRPLRPILPGKHSDAQVMEKKRSTYLSRVQVNQSKCTSSLRVPFPFIDNPPWSSRHMKHNDSMRSNCPDTCHTDVSKWGWLACYGLISLWNILNCSWLLNRVHDPLPYLIMPDVFP